MRAIFLSLLLLLNASHKVFAGTSSFDGIGAQDLENFIRAAIQKMDAISLNNKIEALKKLKLKTPIAQEVLEAMEARRKELAKAGIRGCELVSGMQKIKEIAELASKGEKIILAATIDNKLVELDRIKDRIFDPKFTAEKEQLFKQFEKLSEEIALLDEQFKTFPKSRYADTFEAATILVEKNAGRCLSAVQRNALAGLKTIGIALTSITFGICLNLLTMDQSVGAEDRVFLQELAAAIDKAENDRPLCTVNTDFLNLGNLADNSVCIFDECSTDFSDKLKRARSLRIKSEAKTELERIKEALKIRKPGDPEVTMEWYNSSSDQCGFTPEPKKSISKLCVSKARCPGKQTCDVKIVSVKRADYRPQVNILPTDMTELFAETQKGQEETPRDQQLLDVYRCECQCGDRSEIETIGISDEPCNPDMDSWKMVGLAEKIFKANLNSNLGLPLSDESKEYLGWVGPIGKNQDERCKDTNNVDAVVTCYIYDRTNTNCELPSPPELTGKTCPPPVEKDTPTSPPKNEQ